MGLLLAEQAVHQVYPPWSRVGCWLIIMCCVERYGNPALDTFKEEKNKVFAQKFMDRFAPTILHSFLSQMDQSIQGTIWIPKKIVTVMMGFFMDW